MLRSRDRAAGLLCVLCLALWARLTVLPQVFVEGLVLPAFPDAHYHVRRIWQTLEQFPRVPVVDAHLNWPDGGPCPWPPGFDWLGAVFVGLLGGAGDADRAAHTAAFFPIFLGLLVVVATVWVARQLCPPGRSGDAQVLVAGVLAAVLPQAVVVSRLGSVDHHVAEVLSMALLGGWLLWAARSEERPRRSWIRFELRRGRHRGVRRHGLQRVDPLCRHRLRAVDGAPPASSRPGSPERLARSARRTPVPVCCSAPARRRCSRSGLAPRHQPRAGRRTREALGLSLPELSAAAPARRRRRRVLRSGGRVEALLSRTNAVRALRARTGALAALVVLAVAAGTLFVPTRPASCRWAHAVALRSDPWLAGINEFQPLFPSWALWRAERSRRS